MAECTPPIPQPERDVEISLVIPVYNEAQGLSATVETARTALLQAARSHEIVVVDDGSTDRTWEQVQRLAAENTGIRGVRFTRNFGKEAAILAGLRYSRGQAVVVMDGDLQHPPGLIPEMVRLWRERGYQVVHATKRRRQKETWPQRAAANLFYALMKALTGYDLAGGSDFKLLDREVVGRYVNLPESVRFFRGLIPWLGHRNTSLAFDPPARQRGASQWSPLALLRLAVRAICAFSSIPTQIVTILGGVMFASTVILGAQTLYMKLSGRAEVGFSTVILLLLFIGSILMISLGVIGQYLALIYEEVKGRPPYVVAGTLNLERET